MIELLPVSIGIGLAINLFLTEIFGLTAGGLVVPGYFALYLHKPLLVLPTVAAGFIAFAAVQGISSVMVLYGRRRIVLLILVGYLLGMAARLLIQTPLHGEGLDFEIIGFIIPGLIALWIDRYGLLESLTSLVTISVLVRLILVLVFGKEINP
jgi:poly-gamma-glutamate biosynthesis protein PgsC/CapC